MSYVIHYIETAEEIAGNVEAVRATGADMLDLMDVTPEEYVAEWRDLLVCTVDGAWSLGGCEIYEADQFATREDAEAWIAKYQHTEPGTFEVWEA